MGFLVDFEGFFLIFTKLLLFLRDFYGILPSFGICRHFSGIPIRFFGILGQYLKDSFGSLENYRHSCRILPILCRILMEFLNFEILSKDSCRISRESPTIQTMIFGISFFNFYSLHGTISINSHRIPSRIFKSL